MGERDRALGLGALLAARAQRHPRPFVAGVQAQRAGQMLERQRALVLAPQDVGEVAVQVAFAGCVAHSGFQRSPRAG